MMVDLSVQQPENQASLSLADMPGNLVFAQSQSGDTFKELSTTLSCEQTATSRFELSGDESTNRFVWPNFTTKVPAGEDNDMDELHLPRQRAVSYTSTFMEMSPPQTDAQLSQRQYQSHQPMASWPNMQAQIARTQPQTHTQYQAYSPSSSVSTLRSPASEVMPHQILPELGDWAGQIFTSPTMEAATPATSTVEQGNPLSRSMTVGEARRRNQRTLLTLIGRPEGHG
jgi:hypothetical protein